MPYEYKYDWRALERIRKQRGMTQRAVGLHSGLPPSRVCRAESGEHTPTTTTLLKIANGMRIHPRHFFVRVWVDDELG